MARPFFYPHYGLPINVHPIFLERLDFITTNTPRISGHLDLGVFKFSKDVDKSSDIIFGAEIFHGFVPQLQPEFSLTRILMR